MNLLYFSAKWCGPCRGFGPNLSAWAENNSVLLQKIDINEDATAVKTFDVKVVPTVLAMSNGKIKGRLEGARTQKELGEWFNNL